MTIKNKNLTSNLIFHALKRHPKTDFLLCYNIYLEEEKLENPRVQLQNHHSCHMAREAFFRFTGQKRFHFSSMNPEFLKTLHNWLITDGGMNGPLDKYEAGFYMDHYKAVCDFAHKTYRAPRNRYFQRLEEKKKRELKEVEARAKDTCNKLMETIKNSRLGSGVKHPFPYAATRRHLFS